MHDQYIVVQTRELNSRKNAYEAARPLLVSSEGRVFLIHQEQR
jgi:hypothetical protein